MKKLPFKNGYCELSLNNVHQQGFIQMPGPSKPETTLASPSLASWLLANSFRDSFTATPACTGAGNASNFKKSVGKRLLTNNQKRFQPQNEWFPHPGPKGKSFKCQPHSSKMISLFGPSRTPCSMPQRLSWHHLCSRRRPASTWHQSYRWPQRSITEQLSSSIGTYFFGKLGMIPHEVHSFEQYNW